MVYTPSDQSPDKKVSDFRGMRRILEGLTSARALLTIIIGNNDNEFYSSAILAVYPDERQFVMDELNPKSGHTKLLQTETLKAYALLRGVKVFFTAQIRKTSIKDGISYYVFSFPDYIYYEQLRSHYRVNVIGAKKTVQLNKTEGRLIDLSLGGIGAEFPVNMGLEEGDQINGAALQLPDGHQILCDLEICNITGMNDKRHCRIGARFINLDHDRERQIQRIVNLLEREELRHAPRD